MARCTSYNPMWSNLSVGWWVGTDCIGSCKSNYHTITTTAAPNWASDVFSFVTYCIYFHVFRIFFFSFFFILSKFQIDFHSWSTTSKYVSYQIISTYLIHIKGSWWQSDSGYWYLTLFLNPLTGSCPNTNIQC